MGTLKSMSRYSPVNLIWHEGDWLYSGTSCVAGNVYYRAEQVGVQSVAEKLTIGARLYREMYTPLQGEISLIIRVLLLVALFLELLLHAASIVSFIPIVVTAHMAMGHHWHRA